MEKICGVYRITNKVTGDFYIGSSKNVMRRWRDHKQPSRHRDCPNNRMYRDMDELGFDSFDFEILEEVKSEELRAKENEYIKELSPNYNDRSAILDVEKMKARQKAYDQSEKKKSYKKAYEKTEKRKAYKKAYGQTEKMKAYQKSYSQSEKYKTYHKAYSSQLCNYDGETLTLQALGLRFKRQGIPNPFIEAKKFLIAS